MRYKSFNEIYSAAKSIVISELDKERITNLYNQARNNSEMLLIFDADDEVVCKLGEEKDFDSYGDKEDFYLKMMKSNIYALAAANISESDIIEFLNSHKLPVEKV